MPPAPRATLGTPQVVQTQHRQICVHTRLIDEVHEWKIQQSLRMVREMGATTIVEFFPWAYIEPSPGNYNWSQVDTIMQHAQNQGIQVIARLGYVPEWARPTAEDQSTTLNYLTSENYADFAAFAAKFASRYKNEISQIIIWNEPNLSFEWGFQAVDPAAYANLLQAVYPVIKEANPDVEILAGALAPTLESADSANGMNDIDYLRGMYEAGAGDSFDALAIHTYGFTYPAEATPSSDTLNFRRAELLRAVMTEFGDEVKPVYITEMGWNDHPRWANSVTPAQRAQYTIKAFQWADENWPWAKTLCVWALRYPAPTYNYPDYFTLLTPAFQAKPIYYAIQDYAHGDEQETPLWYPPPIIEER
ncbi:beta-galactosidase [Phototrophicus methaneseepsis]|uniref:Beta-galactosidase n=1 Tax=Phototrophicus methaneseepsis TaxID=2710758 RepID=A0A7S8E5L2_9CHLR|nr:beta-galactosidase [Phototrophicus methaneseepsis]QPC80807.1 beta-galactosidase [Phototrophicus methaneseepsis]